jgi:GDP-4-dehydro-6-deoxy-D-mannose reductase
MDVEDVVDAYLRLIDSTGLPDRATFNVASGEAHPIGELLERLRAFARASFDIKLDPHRLRPSEVPCAVGDASMLRRMTGWNPRRSTDDMLSRLLDHWRERLSMADPR